MEDLGKKLASKGQKFGEGAEKFGSDFDRMWYGTLGILAPVIGGLIAVVVFLVFVLVVGAVANGSEHRDFWEELRSFLEVHFLLFAGLFFLSSFTNYFNKVHRRTLRWVTPVMSAVGFTAWCWILAQVLFIGAGTLDRSGLEDLGDSLTDFLPVIFVAVLLIAYIVTVYQSTKEKVSGNRA